MKHKIVEKKKFAPRHQPDLTYYEALYLAWKRGLVRYKLLPHQNGLYDIISKPKKRKTVVNCSRRFGKTTTLLIYALSFGIANPGSLIRFVSATQKTIRKNIFPIIRELLEDCPEEFKPVWDTQESCYKFKNGSEMHIYGTDMQNHDSLRGQRTDLAIVDEAAYCSDLKYTVDSILVPQTLTCDGHIIIASTPQKNVTQSGEEFKEYCQQAELSGAYHTKTIYENTSLSKKLIKEYMEEAGGEDSVTWQVEYMCKFMVDPEKRIIPEWSTDKMVYEVPEPEYYHLLHKYVGMDLGGKRDFTAILFGYYDFPKAKLVILDELVFKNKTTQEMASAMLEKEQTYFTNQNLYRRIADNNNPQLILDMASNHSIAVIQTSKDTLEAMINELRIFIAEGRLVVHPRCKYLISNMEHGVWANSAAGKAHKDFAKTEVHGHFDGLSALNYLVRNLDTSTNPIPSLYNLNPYNNSYDMYTNQTNNLSRMFKRIR
jgi:phage terminase large subunit